jgi:hypothetical protein
MAGWLHRLVRWRTDNTEGMELLLWCSRFIGGWIIAREESYPDFLSSDLGSSVKVFLFHETMVNKRINSETRD